MNFSSYFNLLLVLSLDACVESPCKNGGTCVDSGTGTKCLCLPTYGGDFCQTGELCFYNNSSHFMPGLLLFMCIFHLRQHYWCDV